MALVLINTKGQRPYETGVFTTRPVTSQKIAAKVAQITGIRLPVYKSI